MSQKCVLLFIVFALINVIAFSQLPVEEDPYIKFDHLNVKNGLSNNYILDIYQDNKGYLWIATRNGLNQYNGYDFIVYKNSIEDSSSLSSSLVTSISEDKLNNLWIGTNQGLNRLDKRKSCFVNYLSPGHDTSVFPRENVRAIFHDSSNILWVENAEGKLRKIRPNGDVDVYKHDAPSMVNTYFYHSIIKNKNQLWLGGRYMGLIRFDIEKEEFYKLVANSNEDTKKRDNDVGVYFVDSRGVLWVGGTDGLYTLDEEKEIFSKKLTVSTFSIAEDNNGYLYFGTGGGLYILDEKQQNFRRCSHDDNNKASITNNHINKVFIDRSGNIWIGTIDGLSVIRPSMNKFNHIYHIPGNKYTPSSNHVTAILQDKENRIWYGADGGGVEVFTKEFQKTATYSSSLKGKYKLASDRVSVLMEDKSGDIWIGQWTGLGFNIVNHDKGRNKQIKFLDNSLNADWYSGFVEDRSGNYWVGLWGAMGLYRFGKESKEFLSERFYAFDYSNRALRNIAFDGKYVWLGLKNQNRFYFYNTDEEKFQIHSKENYNPYDFNRIIDITTKNKNLFVVTDNGFYSKNKIPFTEIIETLPKPIQKTQDQDQEKRNLEKEFGIMQVNSILYDDKNTLWIASTQGLFEIIENRINVHYNTKSLDLQNFPTDTIWDMSYQKPDKLWLGTDKGLVSFDIQKKVFHKITYPANKYLSSRLTSFLFEDSKGFIWIGTTDNGLNRLDPLTREVRSFIEVPGDSTTFLGRHATCIFEDNTGVIWVGGKGLNRYNSEDQSFLHYTEDDGLCNNDVKAILEDDSGNLWVSTAFGLSKFNIKTGVFEDFFEKDGLQDNEFSSAACRLSDSRLVFGGKNGINVFKPEGIKKNMNMPEIEISGFRIFEKDVNHLLEDNNTLRLNYDQNYFSFDFVALDYSNPEQNLYAYKLENFDDKWIYTAANNRVARYTNVDPGKYTLRIKAANSDGIWNESGINIPILIKPPYWKTIWFFILEIVILVLIVVFIIKYREKKIIEENQFQLLEQKLLRSQMNPHFIFNSLSSIQSFIFENSPLEAGSYLSRFAELIRAILYNSREEFITIEKEIKTLKNYLDLQQLRYNNKFDYILDVDPLIEADLMEIPPMLAQPFIENAIEHGIKHLDVKGLISVSFTLMANNESVLLLVEDNGIGIKASKKTKSAKPKSHTSLATVIANERINVFNKGKKKKQFIMDINEIIGSDGKVKGTKVKFVIPYRNFKPFLK